MKITRFCPAKLNLFLEVTGRRPNGYHELATLFAKISVGDTLTISVEPTSATKLSLTLTGPVGRYLKADESNLVCRAARKFLEYFHLTAQVDMLLDKHVPTGAGLGGGSSDAAHTLLALCDIFHQNKNELLPLAAQLGADVPLFMYEETFLRGEGIGEQLTPLAVTEQLPWIVLVYPNTSISTKEVFANFTLPSREEATANCKNLDKLISHLSEGKPLYSWKDFLFNRLEDYVVPLSKPVRDTLADMKQMTDAVLMSGSGSTVFALVETEEAAHQLACQIQDSKRTVFCTTFYKRSV